MSNIGRYIKRLLDHGFAQANQRPLHFWKILTEKTAFIVNLKEIPVGVGVVYGVISTAVFWTDGDWDYFKQQGKSDGDINLRFYLEIGTENDEMQADDVISELYQTYLHRDKDELLARVKERRKQFLQEITNVLKPLGFRKKGNQWRRMLTDDMMLQFWADKSPYADLYYFEVGVYSMLPPGGMLCCGRRLDTKRTEVFDWKNYSESGRRFDWQLQSVDTLLEIVHRAYEEELKPFIENDLTQMGKQPFVWKACICKRTICENCWVEKNYWEAKNSEASAVFSIDEAIMRPS